ncbi:carboxypeptidase M32 [Candidatus Woesearchaeota archaeon]|nr:carboxypeptidase M32 [Candidatus Woesearchaeota archaeon]
MTTYDEFIELTKKAYTLMYVEMMLDWDQQVNLTKGGQAIRAKQLSVCSALHHEILTSERMGELLEQLENDASLNKEQKANVSDVARQYHRMKNVPSELIEEFTQTRAEAYHVWEHARDNDDFASFAPILKKLVELSRKIGAALDSEKPVYENLIHEYEPHMSAGEIRQHIEKIKEALVPLIKEISSQEQPDTQILKTDVPESAQLLFAKDIAKKLGFDFEYGRLDKAVHPFTGHVGDVRITTRFSEGWWDGLSATIHEVGHGIYEQNLPKEHFATPLGSDCFMSIHESQSRLFENHIGLSKDFWGTLYPELKDKFGLENDFETFFRAINKAGPSFIRVQADELTYPLHIIMRFELEEALISGELSVDDLPRVWNEKFTELLGITPTSNREGVLQDVHWSAGLFGYFPTYLIGSMISAQLWKAAEHALPDLAQQIRNGDIQPLNDWLKENIHRHGRRYPTKELVRRATGNEPRPDEYLEYLEKKYRSLYSLKASGDDHE